MSCKFADCGAIKIHAKKFCVKHYKHYIRGHLDIEGNRLTNFRSVYRETDTCLVEDCSEKPRRNNFCESHSAAVRTGRIFADGLINFSFKTKRVYAADYVCLRCSSEKPPFLKGFCRNCYRKFTKKLIDEKGVTLSLLQPPPQCKVSRCRKSPVSMGFCLFHQQTFQKGRYTFDGTRIRFLLPTCRVSSCERPNAVVGYCHSHYNKYLAGRLYETTCIITDCAEPIFRKRCCKKHDLTLVNSGKICSFKKCGSPAVCKTFCSKHYYLNKKGLETASPGIKD